MYRHSIVTQKDRPESSNKNEQCYTEFNPSNPYKYLLLIQRVIFSFELNECNPPEYWSYYKFHTKVAITKEVKDVTLGNKFPSNHFNPLFVDFINIKPGSNKIVVLYFRNRVNLKQIVLLGKQRFPFKLVHISCYTISTNAKPTNMQTIQLLLLKWEVLHRILSFKPLQISFVYN